MEVAAVMRDCVMHYFLVKFGSDNNNNNNNNKNNNNDGGRWSECAFEIWIDLLDSE